MWGDTSRTFLVEVVVYERSAKPTRSGRSLQESDRQNKFGGVEVNDDSRDKHCRLAFYGISG